MIDGMGFRENVRREISLHYSGNVSRFAKEHGMSNSYLNEILSGKKRLNEDTLNKFSKALGLPLYALFADEPVVPFKQREPQIKQGAAEAVALDKASAEVYEPVKLFNDLISLGPGFELSEMVPDERMDRPFTFTRPGQFKKSHIALLKSSKYGAFFWT